MTANRLDTFAIDIMFVCPEPRYDKFVRRGTRMQYYLAVDIGASSGRHILGHVENKRMILKEMYRFHTQQIHKNGHDCWDLDALWHYHFGRPQGL